MSEKPHLVEIQRRPEQGSVRLIWSDGHQADYDNDYLRGYCPCAGCQGHGAMTIEFHQASMPVKPISIQPVGNYAVSFQWSDGHDTGCLLYTSDAADEVSPV